MSNVTARSLKRTAAAALAALAMAATVAATPAQAGNGRNAAFAAAPWAAGARRPRRGRDGRASLRRPAGLLRQPAPRYRRTCWTERQPVYDAWGDYAGTRRVRVCN